MNINQLMKQAQVMQKKMQEAQEKLEQVEIEGTSGGGLVKVTITGKGLMKATSIDESLLTSDNKEVLEDLIIAAYNNAKEKLDEESSSQMGDLTGGLNLPAGFKMPF